MKLFKKLYSAVKQLNKNPICETYPPKKDKIINILWSGEEPGHDECEKIEDVEDIKHL